MSAKQPEKYSIEFTVLELSATIDAIYEGLWGNNPIKLSRAERASAGRAHRKLMCVYCAHKALKHAFKES